MTRVVPRAFERKASSGFRSLGKAVIYDDMSCFRSGNAVDLSRYNEKEREIINLMQKGEARPLTQEQINNGLGQARAILGEDLDG